MSHTAVIFEWTTSSSGADRLAERLGVGFQIEHERSRFGSEIIAEGPAWDAQPCGR